MSIVFQYFNWNLPLTINPTFEYEYTRWSTQIFIVINFSLNIYIFGISPFHYSIITV